MNDCQGSRNSVVCHDLYVRGCPQKSSRCNAVVIPMRKVSKVSTTLRRAVLYYRITAPSSLPHPEQAAPTTTTRCRGLRAHGISTANDSNEFGRERGFRIAPLHDQFSNLNWVKAIRVVEGVPGEHMR